MLRCVKAKCNSPNLKYVCERFGAIEGYILKCKDCDTSFVVDILKGCKGTVEEINRLKEEGKKDGKDFKDGTWVSR